MMGLLVEIGWLALAIPRVGLLPPGVLMPCRWGCLPYATDGARGSPFHAGGQRGRVCQECNPPVESSVRETIQKAMCV